MGLIVALCGAAGSGKTTFAGRLIREHGFREASFADSLKNLCAKQFGWNRAALDYDDAAQAIGYPSAFAYKEEIDPILGVTRRVALVKVASIFRDLDPLHFVKKCLDRLETVQAEGHPAMQDRPFVITDTRFKNEVETVQERGGVLVRLNRASPPVGGVKTSADGHASETEWRAVVPDFEFTIPNGVENVEAAADDLVELLRTRGAPRTGDRL